MTSACGECEIDIAVCKRVNVGMSEKLDVASVRIAPIQNSSFTVNSLFKYFATVVHSGHGEAATLRRKIDDGLLRIPWNRADASVHTFAFTRVSAGSFLLQTRQSGRSAFVDYCRASIRRVMVRFRSLSLRRSSSILLMEWSTVV